jgi:methylase of polypeptide subunit release factors
MLPLALPEALPAEPVAVVPAPSSAALRPSEYTAALIQVLRARAQWVHGARALELGSGSGVVLAAMMALRAATVCGIDIDADAVAAGGAMLHGLGGHAELHRGDMWAPMAGRSFDLIAANLPQFPMPPTNFAGRRSSWSCGGASGRCLLDRFLAGLPDHLAAGGRALITHNGFIDLDASRLMAAAAGLVLRVAMTVLVYIHPEKLALMTPEILQAEQGRSLHRYGPFAFGEMHVVEIGRAAALD